MRPSRTAFTLLALALLAVTALAPVAMGDHAYSHRYYILGRVVDSTGAPVQGLRAGATFDGAQDEGPCPGANPPTSRPTTDALGAYFLCYHVHATPPTATITVSLGSGETQVVDLDDGIRRNVVNFQLDREMPDQRGDEEQFTSTYTVRGILWRPDRGTRVEGVSVEGVALSSRNVTATLILADGTEFTGNDRTDTYGDYEVTFEGVPADVGGATVRVGTFDAVHQEDVTATYDADPTFRQSNAPLILQERPADLSIIWWIGGILVVAGLLFAGYKGYEKLRSRQDLEKLREQSGRKRSN